MTKIEIIKLVEDAEVFSILTISYDSMHICQSARLAFSEKSVKRYIQKKRKIADKARKGIVVSWHTQNN